MKPGLQLFVALILYEPCQNLVCMSVKYMEHVKVLNSLEICLFVETTVHSDEITICHMFY